MASRSYQDKDIKLLWGLAAGRCAFPDCRKECILEATAKDSTALIGEIAHIIAHSDKGPRADGSFDQALRNSYGNLILLCPNHHEQVDVHPNTFTISDLRGWKIRHEEWVRGSLAAEMPCVGFAELEVVTSALLASPSDPVTTFTVTNPTLKLQRNGLTNSTAQLLTMGFLQVREVDNFITAVAAIDPTFPERLKAGFVGHYEELKIAGIDGDALFEILHQFASANSREFRRQASGLAVLSYLFEKCEVFEQ
jgi:hypothetical protein